MTTALFMLRCKEIGLTFPETENITIGMVFDMLTERQNDEYKYPQKATQEDFDKF